MRHISLLKHQLGACDKKQEILKISKVHCLFEKVTVVLKLLKISPRSKAKIAGPQSTDQTNRFRARLHWLMKSLIFLLQVLNLEHALSLSFHSQTSAGCKYQSGQWLLTRNKFSMISMHFKSFKMTCLILQLSLSGGNDVNYVLKKHDAQCR